MKVLIQSFSYLRTGYPVDRTGKGGGFVFDCRTIDVFDDPTRRDRSNPFPFMHLTGQSDLVRNALDSNPEAKKFFDALWILIEMEIQTCLRFGFEIMTVNFGCTAGQHRSVYMADRLDRNIRMTFPAVEVELVHLEQSSWPKND